MNILLIASMLPSSPRHYGSPRTYEIFKRISGQHRIVLLAVNCREEEYKRKKEELTRIFTHIYLYEDSIGKTPLSKKVANFFFLKPHFNYRILHPEYYQNLVEKISSITSEHNIDLVYVDTIFNAQYFQTIKDLPIIVDAHDAISLLCFREARQKSGLYEKINTFFEGVFILLFEKAIIRRSSYFFVNSMVDYEFLGGNRQKKLKVVTNGIDFEFFNPRDKDINEKGNLILFTGVFSYKPNELAVCYFLEKVFPLIRQEIPAIKYFAVGPHPTKKMLSHAKDASIVFTGFVDDVRAYYEDADVFACSLPFGTGIKNKVLNAFSMKLPVVGTKISFDGILAQEGKHYLVANSPEQFAENIVCLLKNKPKREKMGREARRLILEKYNWDEIVKTVKSCIADRKPD